MAHAAIDSEGAHCTPANTGHHHDHADSGHSCSGHSHGLLHHHHDYSAEASNASSRKALKQALLINIVFLAIEVIGGVAFNSVALLSDAAHMLMDVGALALALIAAHLACKPVTSRRTYGFARAEIMAALINAVTLVLASGWIIAESARRLAQPELVGGGGVTAVAIAGLGANVWATLLLARAHRANPNITAALMHSLMDALSSVGVIIAGIVIITTGVTIVDPLAGFIIAGLSIAGTWGVLRAAWNSLLDTAPDDLDAEHVARLVLAHHAVLQVHDIHVWELGAQQRAATAHVLVDPSADIGRVIEQLEHELRHHLNITHITLQVAHDRRRALLPLHHHLRKEHGNWVASVPLPLG